MRARTLATIAALALAGWAPRARAQDGAADPPAATQPTAWCAPELETLAISTGTPQAAEVCSFAAPASESGRRTLVVFLHGVIQPDTTWQWTQQRGIVLGARRLGFSVLMPRGRRGIGPPGMTDWITWPTSATAQKLVEDGLLAEWTSARAVLEKRNGKAFNEVFVVGFSNGAYFATSLALRGRLPGDGFAAFAGGSAPSFLQSAAKATSVRAPGFVSISTKDRTTVRDSRGLADALRRLRWPHRSESSAVGHAIADAALDHALSFLRGTKLSRSDTRR